MVFSLAEALHKTVGEIEQIPESEFVEWMAYFRLQEEDRERERNKSR